MTKPGPGAQGPAVRPDAMSAPSNVAEVAARLNLEVDGDSLRKLEAYAVMLMRWSATYNLTSLRDPAQVLTHHLADCLAIVAPLRRHLAGSPHARVLDVGSGGGLPGAVLAIAVPGLDVTCVDSVGKKAAFIRQVAAEVGLNHLHAVHARVEQVPGLFDVVTSRAFATLTDFCMVTRERLAPGGAWLAMKGQRPTDEIDALPHAIDVFHVEPIQVPGLDAQRCIVWLRPRRDD